MICTAKTAHKQDRRANKHALSQTYTHIHQIQRGQIGNKRIWHKFSVNLHTHPAIHFILIALVIHHFHNYMLKQTHTFFHIEIDSFCVRCVGICVFTISLCSCVCERIFAMHRDACTQFIESSTKKTNDVWCGDATHAIFMLPWKTHVYSA